jgi:hypothetical protein
LCNAQKASKGRITFGVVRRIAMNDATRVRAPKMLPWLAHKAGISDQRAEVLWKSAERHAAVRTGEVGTSAYWQASMDRLLELIAAEALREDAASFGWRAWSRAQARLLLAPVAAFDAVALAVTRGWRRWGEEQPIKFC